MRTFLITQAGITVDRAYRRTTKFLSQSTEPRLASHFICDTLAISGCSSIDDVAITLVEERHNFLLIEPGTTKYSDQVKYG